MFYISVDWLTQLLSGRIASCFIHELWGPRCVGQSSNCRCVNKSKMMLLWCVVMWMGHLFVHQKKPVSICVNFFFFFKQLLLLLSWCLMSSDVIWHIRDKLWPMPKHGSIRKVYVCLAVTCHLHFWQNDRDFLRATVVTRGWNGYQNKSQHRKSTLEKKILLPFQ